MAGKTDAECVAWRERAKTLLPSHTILDPMKRDFRAVDRLGVKATMDLVEGDKGDIDFADILVVNAADGPSFGTPMEVIYAWERGKTVISIVGDQTKRVSPWVAYHSSYMVEDLAQACALVNKIPRTFKYVLGFLYRKSEVNGTQVALIKKLRPDWQAGKMNGIGGKIEEGEAPLAAMKREFKEEAGVDVTWWREFTALRMPKVTVHCYMSTQEVGELRTTTDELVGWYGVGDVMNLPILDNLRWMIPMGIDKDKVMATVFDPT